MSNLLPYLVHFPELSFNLMLLLKISLAMIDKAMQSCCFRICCCNELGAAGCKAKARCIASQARMGGSATGILEV